MKFPTALAVARITKPGRYAVGCGAYLQITGKGGRSYIFRYGTHYVGLGSTKLVSLAEARAKGLAYRKLLLDGGDPLTAKRQARQARLLASVSTQTFRQCAEGYVAAHEAGWRNPQSRAQWIQSLSAFVYPVVGELPVAAIDTGIVLRVLEPIWAVKPETASRVRGRIESVLDWAKARGYRNGENPARWRGHLDKLLPAKSKLRRIEHFAALPYDEIGTFTALLRRRQETAARALEFLVLTAGRASEVRLARWDEIAGDIWVIPSERTKSNRVHRVPLADRAVRLLAALPREGEYIFAGSQAGAPLGGNSLRQLLRRMGRADLTAHGFRASFKTWASECTNYPRDVVEMALAHSTGTGVEAAYQRGDLFEKRRRLMGKWAEFCALPPRAGKVVRIRGAS
jgi:integrase